VNDGFKHDIDVIKAEAQNRALEDKLFMGLQGLQLKDLQLQVAQMRESSQEKHWQNEDAANSQKKQQKVKERDAEIDNVVKLLDRVIKAEKENPGFAGGRGYLSRGTELAKTTFGGDETGANRFKSDMDELVQRIPKVIPMGSKMNSKWSQEKIDSIFSGVRLGTNAKINVPELEQLQKDLAAEKGQPMDDGTQPAPQPGAIPENLIPQAESIRDQVKSGKMTREQGRAALMALGGNQ
jgi:hypothetical protein